MRSRTTSDNAKKLFLILVLFELINVAGYLTVKSAGAPTSFWAVVGLFALGTGAYFSMSSFSYHKRATRTSWVLALVAVACLLGGTIILTIAVSYWILLLATLLYFLIGMLLCMVEFSSWGPGDTVRRAFEWLYWRLNQLRHNPSRNKAFQGRGFREEP